MSDLCDEAVGDQDGFMHACRRTTDRHEEHECLCGYRWEWALARYPSVTDQP